MSKPSAPRRFPLDRWLPAAVYASTALAFLPVLAWLADRATNQDQLLHGFLVFLFTGALLAVQRHLSLSPVLRFTDGCLYLLLAAYASLAAAVFSPANLLILPALSLFLASLLLYLLGQEQRRFIVSSIIAFTVFTGFAVTMPFLDWPLRSIAGQCSLYALDAIGQDAQLGLFPQNPEPMLLLFNEGRPFHVAAECNGFGLLTSALLLAVILLLFQPLSWYRRIAGILLALATGFFFNTLRIVVIVLLAPFVGDHYLVMHEIVGILFTYSALGLLFFLLLPKAAPASLPQSAP